MSSFLRSPLVFGFAAVAALAGAYIFQYGFGLAPCPLCLYQRWPYMAAIAFSLLAYGFRHKPLYGVWLGLLALSFWLSAALALFHVGVEQHWWRGLDSCQGQAIPTNLEELRAMIENAQPARCDEIAWSFLGISIAGYNLIYAAIMGYFATLFALKDAAHGQTQAR
ncbi:MAG: disulfide bond formation protein B [Dongiaceae bacterium]